MNQHDSVSALADAALTIAIRCSQEYMQRNRLTADPAALRECLAANVKLRLPEAIRDAREAFACHMQQVGVATFSATLTLAGIDAAKECALPPHLLKQTPVSENLVPLVA